jgi:hypothetical protein
MYIILTKNGFGLLGDNFNWSPCWQVSCDNLLWKWLLRRDFKPNNLTLKPAAVSWRDEYERLVDRVPKVKIQVGKRFHSGANPTTSSYNASVVKIYNATSSLHSAFSKQKIFSSALKKRSILLQRWRCSCKFKSRRIGSWDLFLISPLGAKYDPRG